ncbi:MAG: response regulator transcription factor [Crocinitomicaceae bacterium]|nr:response regulator transcription factor [Flavobacteriales bacterium]NQZ35326.1 response regulator transcription factor [Crocinitomicaceae bacterium]
MSRIVIIEDELFAVEHLIKIVNSLDHEVVGDYYSGEEFLENTDWNFDTAIIDIFLAKKLTGIDIAKEMNKRQKSFIFLTANKDSKTLIEAAKLRPSAYLTKPFQVHDVTAALEIIGANKGQEKQTSYLQFLTQNDLSIEPLTQRELDILKSLVEDDSNLEIGEALFISSNTVKYHIRNIYQKFEVKSRDELQEKVSSFILG